jgi:translation initiation factor 2B subunit (eIF-2B alpha/beta/delta family)
VTDLFGSIERRASSIEYPVCAWHNLHVSHRDEIIELFSTAAADREHGAAEIETTLIRGLLDIRAGLRLESLHRGLKMLAEGQPAMANLRAMAAWMAGVESPASCVSRLVRRAAVLEQLPDRLAANSWPLVEKSQTVVTISRSSAVAAVLEGAWQRGWDGSVVVLDGKASGRGADQARRLAISGPAVSKPDGDAPKSLDQVSVVVLVGADAVGRLRFVNSAGTEDLLQVARCAGVETVLVADSSKDVTEDDVDDIVRLSPLHRDAGGEAWSIFEAVPLELVTARVTE